MLLGTRLEYCLSDLLSGTVSTEDVYLIVTSDSTNFSNSLESDEWWERSVDPMTLHLSQGKNYLHLYDYEDALQLIHVLLDEGKLVQRERGNPFHNIRRMQEDGRAHWYQINLREVDMVPAVKEAWEYYKMLAGLCK